MSSARLQLAQADFKIPAPRGTPAPAPGASGTDAPPAPSAPPPTPGTTHHGGAFDDLLPKTIPASEIAVALAIFVLLLVPFFFAKMSVTRGLQTRYAAPGPASEAGWLLFAWLAFTTLVVMAAVVANIWARLPIIVPAAAISIVLLVLFMRKRALALRTRR